MCESLEYVTNIEHTTKSAEVSKMFSGLNHNYSISTIIIYYPFGVVVSHVDRSITYYLYDSEGPPRFNVAASNNN